MTSLPWARCFEDPDNAPAPAQIKLRQVSQKSFVLESSMRYTGPTGVDGLTEQARTLRPADLGPDAETDLTSVPAALRWFVGPYGVHTPAALLHDRLIGTTAVPGVSDSDADRFFRFMLKELGVRFIRRWMMWTAVAFGTRWRAGGVRQLSVLLWSITAVLGMAALVYGIAQGNLWIVAAALVAPFVAAGLWEKQYGAGLAASLSAIWILPPTVVGAVGYVVYVAFENFLSLVLPSKQAGHEPTTYQYF